MKFSQEIATSFAIRAAYEENFNASQIESSTADECSADFNWIHKRFELLCNNLIAKWIHWRRKVEQLEENSIKVIAHCSAKRNFPQLWENN